MKLSQPLNLNVSSIAGLILVILWMSGIVVVKGFWWTLLTIILPPFGVYFGVELFLKFFGVL